MLNWRQGGNADRHRLPSQPHRGWTLLPCAF